MFSQSKDITITNDYYSLIEFCPILRGLNHSPWSQYAGYPPAIVDFYGDFYGYLTGNSNIESKTDYELFAYIVDNFEYIKANYIRFGSCFRKDGSFDVNTWQRLLEGGRYDNYNNNNNNSGNKAGNKVNFYTRVKSSGQIWVEAFQGRSIAPVALGTNVQVIGYEDGFWKIISNGIIGYLSPITIEETPEMQRFKRSVD